MKLKNNWKRFWTLDRHHAAGFTLVELIVVIAILAILAGVGIPVYSGYITKANKQADLTLISEVENALTLGYYAGNLETDGYVILQYNAAPKTSGEDVNAVLTAAFGENSLQTMVLKHNGWNSQVTESTFSNNEVALTNHVASLTGVLRDNLVNHKELLNGRVGFEQYMKDELNFGADELDTPEKVADAAVLYIANSTTQVNQKDFVDAVEGSYGQLGGMFNNLIPVYGGSYVQAAAASYAMMIGYIQYLDNESNTNYMADVDAKMAGLDVNLTSTSSAGDVFNTILMPLQEVIGTLPADPETGIPNGMQQYWETQVGKDATAFIDLMGTVTDSKDVFVNNLGSGSCYNSDEVKELFAAYTNGGVVIRIDSEGSVTNNLT